MNNEDELRKADELFKSASTELQKARPEACAEFSMFCDDPSIQHDPDVDVEIQAEDDNFVKQTLASLEDEQLAKNSGVVDSATVVPTMDQIIGIDFSTIPETDDAPLAKNFRNCASGPGRVLLVKTDVRDDDGLVLVQKFNDNGEECGSYFIPDDDLRK